MDKKKKPKLDANKLLKVRNILIGVASGLGATTIASTGIAVYFATRKTETSFIVEGENRIIASQSATFNVFPACDVTWSIDDTYLVGDVKIDQKGELTTSADAYGWFDVIATDKKGDTSRINVYVYPPYEGSESVWSCVNDKWYALNMNDLSSKVATAIRVVDFELTETTIEKKDFVNTDIYVGDELTKIPDNFCESMSDFNGNIIFPLNSKCTVIGKCFMQDCTSFNKKLELPSSLDVIDEGFLDGCSSYNNDKEELVLPNNLTSIGDWFMHGCTKFIQSYTIPSLVTHVGDNFMCDCDGMYGATLTIQCEVEAFSAYGDDTLVVGTEPSKPVYIAGEHADAFIQRFPNKPDSSPYRLLKKAQ